MCRREVLDCDIMVVGRTLVENMKQYLCRYEGNLDL
jgi:hypothetical protein